MDDRTSHVFFLVLPSDCVQGIGGNMTLGLIEWGTGGGLGLTCTGGLRKKGEEADKRGACGGCVVDWK